VRPSSRNAKWLNYSPAALRHNKLSLPRTCCEGLRCAVHWQWCGRRKIKLSAKGFDFYLNKYAQQQFGRDFFALSETERGSVYYAVIESAGRDNARVTATAARMQVLGKSLILFTAILAVGEIVHAKNKVREAARQGSIIAAGMIGGAAAGAAVSFICGPAEPICAVATVTIGSNLGGMAGQVMFDFYQDELDAFNELMWH